MCSRAKARGGRGGGGGGLSTPNASAAVHGGSARLVVAHGRMEMTSRKASHLN